MRLQDIKLGEYYRLRNTSGEFCDYYGWLKVLKIYRKGDYLNPHPQKLSCVECEHTVDKCSTVGFIRYFRPMDLVKPKPSKNVKQQL